MMKCGLIFRKLLRNHEEYSILYTGNIIKGQSNDGGDGVKVAIIDDRNEDRMQVEEYLTKFFAQFHYLISLKVVHFESGEEFLSEFKKGEYALIFIDQYMKEISGMEVARQIRMEQDEAVLVFVTTSTESAVEGYKMRVAGYLVKPFTYEQFTESLISIHMKQLEENQFICIPFAKDHEKILLKDILYCDVQKHYCYIHLKTNGYKKIRMSFYQLKEILEPYPQFLTCYCGCVVNMNEIKRITPLAVELKHGERIPFRKKEYSKIMKIYSDFIFSMRQLQKIMG